MIFLKPSKNKIKIFLFMIPVSLVLSSIVILISRFAIENYYCSGCAAYRLFFLIIGALRYFLFSFFVISFASKKFSFAGQYYNILKVVMLLFSFNVLTKAFYVFLYKITPLDISMSYWFQASYFIYALLIYYIIACYIHNFNKL